MDQALIWNKGCRILFIDRVNKGCAEGSLLVLLLRAAMFVWVLLEGLYKEVEGGKTTSDVKTNFTPEFSGIL